MGEKKADFNFKTLDVLSKLEGLWLNRNFEIMYAVATRITFICPMTFNSFPLDVQVCRFQVGSFNYDTSKMVFLDEFIADEKQIRSVLDYFIEIKKLPDSYSYYVALTGKHPKHLLPLSIHKDDRISVQEIFKQ